MKKLLALILCVAMVLSLAPAAFAAGTTGGKVIEDPVEYAPKWAGTGASKKAIEDLNKDINAMYTAIAADQAVFGTVKSIYDMTDSLAKGLFDGIESAKKADGTKVYNDDLTKNTRKYLNAVIGNEIANYLNSHQGAYTNDKGNIKPAEYMNTFVTAVNKAVSSEKAQKNIAAIIYGITALKVQTDVNDKADDLYTDIKDWGLDKFQEFGLIGGNLTQWTVDDPKDNYVQAWLPANDVLIATGSEATSSDAAAAYDAMFGTLLPTA